MISKTTNIEYVMKTFRLNADVSRALDTYSRLTGVTRTFILYSALVEYLDKHGFPVTFYNGEYGADEG